MTLPIETGPDDLRAHPRHTGRHGLDLVLALAAIFISIVSLFVAVEHGRVERKMLAAGTWPSLQVEEEDENDRIELFLINAGVGPAKLGSLRALVGGEVVPTIAAFERRCCGNTPDVAARFLSGEYAGSVLRPGQRNMVLRFDAKGASPALLRSVQHAVRELRWEGCYCSVLDECWLSRLDGFRTRTVPDCPPRPDSFNSGFFS